MLTRRDLLLSSAMAGLVFAMPFAPSLDSAQAQTTGSPAEATAFVVALGNALTGIVNGPSSSTEKARELEPMIENAVDVDGIARFCLGRFARTATPPQLQEFQALFHRVLINNITGKLGEFKGLAFRPTTTTQRDQDILVGTLITRPNQQPNNVQWVVNQVGGKPRIVDVIAEGTSLRLTQRSDYASYLSRNNNNLDALITAIKQQLAR